MSAERDLLKGIGELLGNAGIGITYRDPDGDDSIYASTETGVFFGHMPEAPDRVVILNWIPAADNIVLPWGTGMIQVGLRSVPDDTLDLIDLSSDVKGILHGLTNTQFGQAFLVQMNRISSIAMGDDDSDRDQLADHYLLDVNFPGTANIPEDGI